MEERREGASSDVAQQAEDAGVTSERGFTLLFPVKIFRHIKTLQDTQT